MRILSRKANLYGEVAPRSLFQEQIHKTFADNLAFTKGNG